ncbi:MAG: quinone-dependent dihydroorotate dehydrogenase [Pirellulaceae bacterium]
MTLYRHLIRPLLFRLDPEFAHRLSISACRYAALCPGIPQLLGRYQTVRDPVLQSELAGLTFANPIGLAAGWDKSGQALRLLGSLGLGFAEIGSISSQPSLGNPRPRLFRLPTDRALVVNYGLPNDGAECVRDRLSRFDAAIPLGINIVKTNHGSSTGLCSETEILSDYLQSVTMLHAYASYLMLNLSCPNAEGGQDYFAQPGNISKLLQELRSLEMTCPVFLKVPPDPSAAAMERLIGESHDFGFVKGFMFNLPRGKPESLRLQTASAVWRNMPGAVSGPPVAALIDECIRELYSRMPRDRFHIIAAGGTCTAEDAYRRIQLGASLIQIYTALVYEGPAVIPKINRGLARLLERDGHQHISDAIGTA